MISDNNYEVFTSQLVAVQRRLYAYILTLLPNLADADDILQETNSALLRSRDEFVPGTEFGAWACRVAYFQVLTFRKRQQREHGRLSFVDEGLLQTFAREAETRWEGLGKSMLAKLTRCMDQLADSCRQLLKLRYEDNLTSKQIAAQTGRTDDAVRRSLFRTRRQLLACLEQDPENKEDES